MHRGFCPRIMDHMSRIVCIIPEKDILGWHRSDRIIRIGLARANPWSSVTRTTGIWRVNAAWQLQRPENMPTCPGATKTMGQSLRGQVCHWTHNTYLIVHFIIYDLLIFSRQIFKWTVANLVMSLVWHLYGLSLAFVLILLGSVRVLLLPPLVMILHFLCRLVDKVF